VNFIPHGPFPLPPKRQETSAGEWAVVPRWFPVISEPGRRKSRWTLQNFARTGLSRNEERGFLPPRIPEDSDGFFLKKGSFLLRRRK